MTRRFIQQKYTTRWTRLAGTYIDPTKIKKMTRNEIIQERRVTPMDLRYKTKMCHYGSCRVEFYVNEVGGGTKMYCDTHRHIPLMLTQRKYRKTHREIIIKRNNDWWVRNGGAVKQHEYYLKRKALKVLQDSEKLEAITHG